MSGRGSSGSEGGKNKARGGSSGVGGKGSDQSSSGIGSSGSGTGIEDRKHFSEYGATKSVDVHGKVNWLFDLESQPREGLDFSLCLWCHPIRYFYIKPDLQKHQAAGFHVRENMMGKRSGGKWEEVVESKKN